MQNINYIAEESEINRTPEFSTTNLRTDPSDPHFQSTRLVQQAFTASSFRKRFMYDAHKKRRSPFSRSFKGCGVSGYISSQGLAVNQDLTEQKS